MKRLALFAAIALATTACSASTRWGNTVVFNPAVDGYAFERFPSYPLVDRFTRKKVRCGEEITAALSEEIRGRAAYVESDRADLVSAWPVAVGTIGTGAPGLVMALGGALVLAPVDLTASAVASKSGGAFFEDGRRAFDAGDDARAASLFEVALARDETQSGEHCARCDAVESLYWLGRAEERRGRAKEAERAYLEFVERAVVEDERAFKDAEARLVKINPNALPVCKSQGKTNVVWPKL